MNLQNRIKKLEQRQKVDEITVEVRGDKFFVGNKELSGTDLERLSATCETMVFINYIDDAGMAILDGLNLQCETDFPLKWYRNWSPREWRVNR